jgi:hypothetical protein
MQQLQELLVSLLKAQQQAKATGNCESWQSIALPDSAGVLCATQLLLSGTSPDSTTCSNGGSCCGDPGSSNTLDVAGRSSCTVLQARVVLFACKHLQKAAALMQGEDVASNADAECDEERLLLLGMMRAQRLAECSLVGSVVMDTVWMIAEELRVLCSLLQQQQQQLPVPGAAAAAAVRPELAKLLTQHEQLQQELEAAAAAAEEEEAELWLILNGQRRYSRRRRCWILSCCSRRRILQRLCGQRCRCATAATTPGASTWAG